MTDRVGQKIGNYRLVHLLGQGGFAGVYLAEHLYLGSSAHTSLNNLASTGGTPYYMVPERTVSGSVTHRQRPVLSGCRCLRVAMRYTTLY